MNFIIKSTRISGIIVLLFLICSCKEDPAPPLLTTTDVTGITQTGASSGGNITSDEGGEIIVAGVCWSTSSNPSVKDKHTNDGKELGSFTSNLKALTPNTKYYVRAYAYSDAGTGYGNEISFTTTPIIGAALTTASVTAVTSNSAISGGNITSDGGGNITARGVCWSTTQNPTIANSKTSDGIGSGSFISTLINLQPETTYYVKAYATNGSGTSYGNELTFKTSSISTSGSQIIADHTIVDRFDDIPEFYINEVKKMWLSIPGESHANAYGTGLTRLETSYPTYDVNETSSGTPEAYTTSHLRISKATWGDYSNSSGWIYDYGEEDWWTNATAVSRTKAGIQYAYDHSLTIGAIGFGWCTDMFYASSTSSADPVYGCHWTGASKEGPSGNTCWGLDDEDNAITGNTVNLDTYLSVTQQYIDYCTANSIPTKVFFTTGPVDGTIGGYTVEKGYVAYLKHERIRSYVNAGSGRILFDYADILCYDNDGTLHTDTWSGHAFPMGTPANCGTEQTGHITYVGAERLAKAMWWMLARMAGWDGGTGSTIPVTGITVTGANGAKTITTDNGTLQLNAAVSPSNATNQTITWSISNGTGQATISTSGLVTAIANGTVTATATANDGSGVNDWLEITISNQVNVIPVSAITVTGAGGATTIATNKGTLQLSAAITPANATNKAVTWSISNGTGQASISASGLVTAIANGTVTARATAADGSGVYSNLVITISNQVISVKGITVTGSKGTTSITSDNGTLELSASISPSNATNQTVSWSIINETGQASISATGLVTAISNGTVTAQATANDGSGVFGRLIISISNQVNLVEGIIITGEGGATTITEDNGTLQLNAAITPVYATNPTVKWSISNGTGQASISNSGLVKAIANGTVTAIASANDGSGAEGMLEITIKSKSSEPLVVIVNENELKIPLDESFANSILSLYNLQGHLIKSKLLDSSLCTFDISTLPAGLYIIILSKKIILKVGKVIIPG